MVPYFFGWLETFDFVFLINCYRIILMSVRAASFSSENFHYFCHLLIIVTKASATLTWLFIYLTVFCLKGHQEWLICWQVHSNAISFLLTLFAFLSGSLIKLMMPQPKKALDLVSFLDILARLKFSKQSSHVSPLTKSSYSLPVSFPTILPWQNFIILSLPWLYKNSLKLFYSEFSHYCQQQQKKSDTNNSICYC